MNILSQMIFLAYFVAPVSQSVSRNTFCRTNQKRISSRY